MSVKICKPPSFLCCQLWISYFIKDNKSPTLLSVSPHLVSLYYDQLRCFFCISKIDNILFCNYYDVYHNLSIALFYKVKISKPNILESMKKYMFLSRKFQHQKDFFLPKLVYKFNVIQ